MFVTRGTIRWPDTLYLEYTKYRTWIYHTPCKVPQKYFFRLIVTSVTQGTLDIPRDPAR